MEISYFQLIKNKQAELQLFANIQQQAKALLKTMATQIKPLAAASNKQAILQQLLPDAQQLQVLQTLYPNILDGFDKTAISYWEQIKKAMLQKNLLKEAPALKSLFVMAIYAWSHQAEKTMEEFQKEFFSSAEMEGGIDVIQQAILDNAITILSGQFAGIKDLGIVVFDTFSTEISSKKDNDNKVKMSDVCTIWKKQLENLRTNTDLHTTLFDNFEKTIGKGKSEAQKEAIIMEWGKEGKVSGLPTKEDIKKQLIAAFIKSISSDYSDGSDSGMPNGAGYIYIQITSFIIEQKREGVIRGYEPYAKPFIDDIPSGTDAKMLEIIKKTWSPNTSLFDLPLDILVSDETTGTKYRRINNAWTIAKGEDSGGSAGPIVLSWGFQTLIENHFKVKDLILD